MQSSMMGPAVVSVMILRALLCGAQNSSFSLPASTQGEKASDRVASAVPTSSPAASHLPLHLTSAASGTAAPVGMLDRKECLPLLMLAGGLALVCALLLLSTLMLTCKVCQMSRRINMLATRSLSCTPSAAGNKTHLETDGKEIGMLLGLLEGGDTRPRAEREEVQENEEKGEEKQKDAEETAAVDESALPKQQRVEENTSDAPSPHGTEATF
uniref:uncharacterized protein LOC131132281 n=1 Tax=Doryrhamphus excisus TaxID=161450 RepID=UPI0025AE1E95|nr:uncharacterized protein LOC131132281 [Doryrhamphus excisus]